MPVPLIPIIIGGTSSFITGRLVKKTLDVRNKQEQMRIKRNTAGLKGSGKAMAKKVYK
jgi:hypothetical protein